MLNREPVLGSLFAYQLQKWIPILNTLDNTDFDGLKETCHILGSVIKSFFSDCCSLVEEELWNLSTDNQRKRLATMLNMSSYLDYVCTIIHDEIAGLHSPSETIMLLLDTLQQQLGILIQVSASSLADGVRATAQRRLLMLPALLRRIRRDPGMIKELTSLSNVIHRDLQRLVLLYMQYSGLVPLKTVMLLARTRLCQSVCRVLELEIELDANICFHLQRLVTVFERNLCLNEYKALMLQHPSHYGCCDSRSTTYTIDKVHDYCTTLHDVIDRDQADLIYKQLVLLVQPHTTLKP